MGRFNEWLLKREAKDPEPGDFAVPPEERARRNRVTNAARDQARYDDELKELDKDGEDMGRRHDRFRAAERRAKKSPRDLPWGSLEFGG